MASHFNAGVVSLGIATHPRFSLRTLIIGISVCAALLYLCVVRPTLLAQRLVAAVNCADLPAVDNLLGGDNWRSWTSNDILPPRVTQMDSVQAELFPRDASDWLRCRRRIVVQIARHWDVDGRHAEWTEAIDLVSRATGVSISPPDADF